MQKLNLVFIAFKPNQEKEMEGSVCITDTFDADCFFSRYIQFSG